MQGRADFVHWSQLAGRAEIVIAAASIAVLDAGCS